MKLDRAYFLTRRKQCDYLIIVRDESGLLIDLGSPDTWHPGTAGKVLANQAKLFECVINFDCIQTPSLLLHQISQILSITPNVPSPPSSPTSPKISSPSADTNVASKQKEFEQFLSKLNIFPPSTGSYDLDACVEMYSDMTDNQRCKERDALAKALGLCLGKRREFRQAMIALVAERASSQVKSPPPEPPIVQHFVESSLKAYQDQVYNEFEKIKVILFLEVVSKLLIIVCFYV